MKWMFISFSCTLFVFGKSYFQSVDKNYVIKIFSVIKTLLIQFISTNDNYYHCFPKYEVIFSEPTSNSKTLGSFSMIIDKMKLIDIKQALFFLERRSTLIKVLRVNIAIGNKVVYSLNRMWRISILANKWLSWFILCQIVIKTYIICIIRKTFV